MYAGRDVRVIVQPEHVSHDVADPMAVDLD
jgi:hypothetical protein